MNTIKSLDELEQWARFNGDALREEMLAALDEEREHIAAATTEEIVLRWFNKTIQKQS